MCTAISYFNKEHYFGRTLDFEHGFSEQIVITPREFPLSFRFMSTINKHYAILGMATIIDNTPLYFDAINEVGLAVAGLLFAGNAKYFSPHHGKTCLPPFELIPFLLATCKNVEEAECTLKNITITDTPFSTELPNSPLHWIVADAEHSIVIESTKNGLDIYENPVGVLTNNPSFPMQMFHLNRYRNLSPLEAENRFSKRLCLSQDSRGMGAIGLPGDYSSPSRFVRAAFLKENSISEPTEAANVNQFFHIMNSVAIPRGAVILKDGTPNITQYTSCCNVTKGIYYYKTYENSCVQKVALTDQNKSNSELSCLPLGNV